MRDSLASSPRIDALRQDVRAWAFAACAATIWFEILWRTTRDAPAASLTPVIAASVGLATQLAFTALETSLGTAAWASLGRQVRWSSLAPALFTASLTEAFAVSVIAEQPPLSQAWRIALTGTRALPEHAAASPIALAFAGLGALTLLRLVFATHAHAAALRERAEHRWRDATLLVVMFYASSRLAIWWGLDLMRGRSFEP